MTVITVLSWGNLSNISTYHIYKIKSYYSCSYWIICNSFDVHYIVRYCRDLFIFFRNQTGKGNKFVVVGYRLAAAAVGGSMSAAGNKFVEGNKFAEDSFAGDSFVGGSFELVLGLLAARVRLVLGFPLLLQLSLPPPLRFVRSIYNQIILLISYMICDKNIYIISIHYFVSQIIIIQKNIHIVLKKIHYFLRKT